MLALPDPAEAIPGVTRLKDIVDCVEIADYTGPPAKLGHNYYDLQSVSLDIQTYVLKQETPHNPRRTIDQTSTSSSEPQQTRILPLPNTAIKHDWNTLVYDDALPARLLRYLVRMLTLLKDPNLNPTTFNWNRLALLHGSPGSGKSTLSRALAQKLSIRLADTFPTATLVEINTNSLLSKYFGESGKLIGTAFENIFAMAQDPNTLICVVMDEVETIASSRERSTSGSECGDGLRATNQLLTALDRLRQKPNVIVLCTSNLITAIDQAFLDRVDIKQMIPSPSPAAIYDIFRSCLNELVRSSLVDVATNFANPTPAPPAPVKATKRTKTRATAAAAAAAPSSSDPWTVLESPEIPIYSEMLVRFATRPQSQGRRLWEIAQRCYGFSGRTLRRLPILGLAMYTWGGSVSLDDAVLALEKAVEQELEVKRAKRDGMEMGCE